MKKDENKNRPIIYIAAAVCIAALVWFVISRVVGGDPKNDDYTYVEFYKDLESEELAGIIINQNSAVPTGNIELEFNDKSKKTLYVEDITEITKELREKGMEYTLEDIKTESFIISLLPMLIFFVAFGSILFTVFGKQMGISLKDANEKKNGDTSKKVTFDNVAGLGEEKAELQEIVNFLKHPEDYTKLGAKIPKGIMLVGPPGTGKTLLARAVAGEAGVPFLHMSGSEFEEMYVGVGASRVRKLFAEAKKKAPCIVFIDEVDAVARKRSSASSGRDENTQTLNQILVEMDGFEENNSIIVIAATNREDVLDPAILRPGRFDRKVFIGRPDIAGREDILTIYAKNKPLGEDVDLHTLAQTTVGFSGADLENLLNEASIIAATSGASYITAKHIEKAFIKVGIGIEKNSRIVSEKEKAITAYHESGHALLFHLLPDVGPVHMVSIVPTGSSGGYTMPLPENANSSLQSRSMMLNTVKAMYGGRLAEEIVFGDITTGASQDIKQATEVVRSMVMEYGMGETSSPLNYLKESWSYDGFGPDRWSEATIAKIDAEVERIARECYDEAKAILLAHQHVLDACAKRLLEKEKILREEFEELVNEALKKEEECLETVENS